MHDYEVLKFGGVAIFGAAIAFFISSPIATFVGLVLFAFGVIAGVFHHMVHNTMTNRL